MEELLKETPLLNYSNSTIQKLIRARGWLSLCEEERIHKIYNYIRDEITFGYNINDAIKASDVLKDGYGQCNTKGTLFMALLRAVGIPCRTHGFYVDKIIQKGTINGFFYKQAPKEVLHSWVEIYYKGQWLNLEGFIIDIKYLNGLQNKFKESTGSFCGYAVAIDDFQNPPISWNENNTYIQKDGIIEDLGIFEDPDDLFLKHQQNVGRFKSFIFQNIVSHVMNRNVKRIRNRKDQ